MAILGDRQEILWTMKMTEFLPTKLLYYAKIEYTLILFVSDWKVCRYYSRHSRQSNSTFPPDSFSYKETRVSWNHPWKNVPAVLLSVLIYRRTQTIPRQHRLKCKIQCNHVYPRYSLRRSMWSSRPRLMTSSNPFSIYTSFSSLCLRPFQHFE